MIKSALQLEFGTVNFLDNIQIAELNEGILFDIPHNQELIALARERFNDQPYGYISNRVNSYSVNPMIYIESTNVSNLIAVAIVSKSPVVKQNALIEKQFFKNRNSFEFFDTLEEAIIWMKNQL